jgi:glycogen(starch) synthase
MHLLFYSPRFYPLVGGLEKVVEYWGNELVNLGVEITLITTTTSEKEDAFSFKVVRNPGFLETIGLMRKADALVQFNVSLKGLAAWIFSGKPLVITHHTLLFEPGEKAPWNQRLKLWVSNQLASLNICCSHYIARQFKNAEVVHSPYDATVFKNLKRERKLGSIAFAGRLVTDKGVDVLLKAMSLVEQAKYSRLFIAGDGRERKALELLFEKQDLREKTRFIGKVNPGELVALLNESEIMVVPSVVEPFGITVLEGLACGCRMVVSDTGGLPEAAGGCALLVKSGDPDALAAAIEKQLNKPLDIDETALREHLKGLTVVATARRFLELIRDNLEKDSPGSD